MAMRIEMFGNLQISQDQSHISAMQASRLQSLVAYLALHSDVPQSREQLAALLWPESSEGQARTNLRQLLHHLRRAMPAGCNLLDADNHTVVWRRNPECFIDVVAFDQAVARAAACRAKDPACERAALEEAARLYQDDLLTGLYDDWVEPKREEYRQRLAQVLSRLAALLEEQNDFTAAIPYVERLVTHDPLRETHHRTLIRLHAANKDRASALRAYHQCMRVLRRELAVEPEAATRELFERVLKSGEPTAAPAEAQASSAARIPLIGRQAELGRLLESWRSTGRGPARLAVISGEPGIGKSRLADELFEWCSQRQFAVARARCYEAQGQLAYAPVAEWLRSEPLRAGRARLPKSQLAELARVLPEILAEDSSMTRPRPLTESWERHHFFESLTEAFCGLRKPLLLVVDDLQWCDPDSLAWMHSLFHAETAAGILMVGTLRPEEAGRDHPFTRLLVELRRLGSLLEFPLLRLSGQETDALATQVSGHPLEAAELDGIYRATEGNPLFVVESVRAGLQGPRIQAVIGARLAKLSPQAYELAGVAGTIGRSFSLDLLAKATDWDEDSLSRALDELWQRSLIHEAGTQYDFSHDRIREVAYRELSPVRRRFWHRRIARGIEELHVGDAAAVSALLGAHYEAAGMPEQAIRRYREAAEVARARFAGSEEIDLLRRALALCRRFPESARRDGREFDLMVMLGPVLVAMEGYAADAAGENYMRALELSRRLGRRDNALAVLSGAMVFHVVRAQLGSARELAQRFLEVAAEEGTPHSGHFPLGCCLFHLGHIPEGRAHMESALAGDAGGSHPALELFAGPDIAVFTRAYLSHMLWFLGYADQSAAISRDCIERARQMAHPFSLSIALDYVAMLHVFRRESEQAWERAEESVAVCREHGFLYYLSMAEIVAGWAQAQCGDVSGGLSRLRQGVESLRATGAELRLPFYHGLLAETCALGGGVGEAMANISTAFAFQNKNGELWTSGDLHRVHGDLLAAGGNAAEAAASYRRAMDAARQTGARMLQLRAAVRLYSVERTVDTRGAVDQLYREFTEGFATADLRAASERA